MHIPPEQELQRHQLPPYPTDAPPRLPYIAGWSLPLPPQENRFSDPCVMSLGGVGLLGGKKRDFSTCYSGTRLADPLRLTPVHVAIRHSLFLISLFSLQSSTEVRYFYVTRGDGGWQSSGLQVVCYLSSWLIWRKLWSQSRVFPFFFPHTIVNGALGKISTQWHSDICLYKIQVYSQYLEDIPAERRPFKDPHSPHRFA